MQVFSVFLPSAITLRLVLGPGVPVSTLTHLVGAVFPVQLTATSRIKYNESAWSRVNKYECLAPFTYKYEKNIHVCCAISYRDIKYIFDDGHRLHAMILMHSERVF